MEELPMRAAEGSAAWRVALVAAWLLWWPGAAAGQPIPKATAEGKKALAELVEGCIKEGGLKREADPKGGPGRLVVVDETKLRATVTGRKGAITPALRDALIAEVAELGPGRWSGAVALLGEVGRATEDALASGYAAFFRGFLAQTEFRLRPAVEEYERAERWFDKAGESAWRATSLNNLGSMLNALGESGKALGYFGQALAMRRALYPPVEFPRGHPDLAQSLNNLGLLLRSLGEYGKAVGYFEQALAMHRALYPPDEHPR